MRRSTTILSFLLFVLLCASVAYWIMQLFKPASRPVAAPATAQAVAPKTDAAASLFGGRGGKSAVASNYQLKGLVLASNLKDSIVILSAEGKPAQAYRASKEIAPGVTVKEVHPAYVVLSENGVARRVELPAELKAASAGGRTEAPVRTTAAPPPRNMPQPAQTAQQPAAPPHAAMPPQQSSPAQQANIGAGVTPPPQPSQPTIAPGTPVQVSGGSSGSGGSGATGAGSPGNAAPGQPVNASAQQPVVVQSPPGPGNPAAVQPGQALPSVQQNPVQ